MSHSKNVAKENKRRAGKKADKKWLTQKTAQMTLPA
jgi:hypothetical protein